MMIFYNLNLKALQDIPCQKNSLFSQWHIIVRKIYKFIHFFMCSKSSHRHVHIYIHQMHVYYDGYKTMDNTCCKQDSNKYFKVHQCHCFCHLWFFFRLFWMMLFKEVFFKMQIYINMQTLFLNPRPVISHSIFNLQQLFKSSNKKLNNFKKLPLCSISVLTNGLLLTFISQWDCHPSLINRLPQRYLTLTEQTKSSTSLRLLWNILQKDVFFLNDWLSEPLRKYKEIPAIESVGIE